MRITTSLEFDTFAEAERVLQHLGALDEKQHPSQFDTEKPVKTNGAARHTLAVASDAAATPAATTTAAPSTAAVAAAPATNGTTLDDVKKAFQAYVGKAGGRTTATAQEILRHHGAVENGIASFKYVRPDQLGVLRRAFETAGPENPLGAA